MMLNIYAVVNFAVSLIFLGIAVFFYFGNSKPLSKIYAAGSFFLALWASEIGFTYFVEAHELRLFLARFGYLVGVAMGFSFFYFMLSFAAERKPSKWWIRLFILIEILLSILFIGTDLAVKDSIFSSVDVLRQTWVFGPAMYIFYPALAIPVISALIVLYRKTRTETDSLTVRKLTHVFWGSILGLTIAVSAAVILPAFDIFYFAWLGPTFALCWVGLNSYALIRQRFIPVRLILAEVLIFILTVVLFLNIFVANPQSPVAQTIQSQAISGVTRTNIYSNIIWISGIFILSFGIISIVRLRSIIGRLFGLYAFLVTLFAAGTGASLFFQDPVIVVGMIRLNYTIGVLVAIVIYYFFYWLFEKKMPPRYMNVTLFCVGVFFVAISGTDLVIKTVQINGPEVIDKFYVYGSLGSIYQTLFVGYFAYLVYTVTHGLRTIQEAKLHKAVSYFWLSTIIAIFIVVGGGFLQPYLGTALLSWIGPTGAFIWMVISFIAVISIHRDDIKQPLLESFILGIAIILFANIFLPTEVSFQIPGKLLVFLSFAAVGVFFVRSIIISERQREELSRLTAELQHVNTNLQTTVDNRTRELRKAKSRTDTVIENLTSGLLEFDNTYTLLRINRAAEQMLGIERAEIVGKKIVPQDFTRPGLMSLVEVSYPIVSTHIKKLPPETSLVGSAVHDITIRYPEERELQVVTAPLVSEEGEVIGFIKALRDVTRERLIARSKSEFITIAAHQLRTPLSVMKWVLGLFLAGEMGPTTDTQREMLTRSNTANEKMIGLVNDLLNVSRIEEGRFGYEFGEIDFLELVRSVTTDYRDLAAEKSITFTVIEPKEAIPHLTLDRSKMQLAIHNLLDNAFHYTRPGGTISLKVALVNRFVEVTVQDSGIGIPREYLNRLFTKFFRAENALKTYTEGSGLGLFIVKNIITRHGGVIEVESEEHEGSIFRFRLPIDATAIPPQEHEV